jgi:aldehyde:ferredoxin oxidoreductase
MAGGFDPMAVKIPKRFLEVTTWKGQADPGYLENLRLAYAKAISEMGRSVKEK